MSGCKHFDHIVVYQKIVKLQAFKMKPWAKIEIDPSSLSEIERLAKDNAATNPGCQLIEYWDGRRDVEIKRDATAGKSLVLGYVGSGWPYKLDQTPVLAKDKYNLARAFPPDGLHHRDVGDAIYQGTQLIDLVRKEADAGHPIRIMDFGSGYGRLSIPLISHWRKSVQYYGVDAVPVSLMIAPQFVKETTGVCTARFDYAGDYRDPSIRFFSVPAWRLKDLPEDIKFDAFVTVHSFQEMTREAVDFYVQWASRHAAPGAVFYSINISPKDRYVPESWKLICDQKYPIKANRDGNYNERIWRIR